MPAEHRLVAVAPGHTLRCRLASQPAERPGYVRLIATRRAPLEVPADRWNAAAPPGAPIPQSTRNACADHYERTDPMGFGFVACAIRDGRRDDDPRVQSFARSTAA
jgi:hypothetical protein